MADSISKLSVLFTGDATEFDQVVAHVSTKSQEMNNKFSSMGSNFAEEAEGMSTSAEMVSGAVAAIGVAAAVAALAVGKRLFDGFSAAQTAGLSFGESLADAGRHLLGMKTWAEETTERMKYFEDVTKKSAAAVKQLNDEINKKHPEYPNLSPGANKAVEDIKAQAVKAQANQGMPNEPSGFWGTLFSTQGIKNIASPIYNPNGSTGNPAADRAKEKTEWDKTPAGMEARRSALATAAEANMAVEKAEAADKAEASRKAWDKEYNEHAAWEEKDAARKERAWDKEYNAHAAWEEKQEKENEKYWEKWATDQQKELDKAEKANEKYWEKWATDQQKEIDKAEKAKEKEIEEGQNAAAKMVEKDDWMSDKPNKHANKHAAMGAGEAAVGYVAINQRMADAGHQTNEILQRIYDDGIRGNSPVGIPA